MKEGLNLGISKNDYKILLRLSEDECTTELKSYTINEIVKTTGLSVSKVRVALRTFKLLNYIAEGAVSKSAKTYYITTKGQEKLKEL